MSFKRKKFTLLACNLFSDIIKITNNNYTLFQLKLSVDFEKIEINNSVYSFVEVMNHIDLKKIFCREELLLCSTKK